jgi:hypothetical protein
VHRIITPCHTMVRVHCHRGVDLVAPQNHLCSKRTDPRMGEQTWRLTNLVRAEPDTSLFAAPFCFQLLDGPQRVMFHANRWGCSARAVAMRTDAPWPWPSVQFYKRQRSSNPVPT